MKDSFTNTYNNHTIEQEHPIAAVSTISLTVNQRHQDLFIVTHIVARVRTVLSTLCFNLPRLCQMFSRINVPRNYDDLDLSVCARARANVRARVLTMIVMVD